MKVMRVGFGFLFWLSASPASAYLDPGSGSMFLQLPLGGLAGLGVIVKLYWHRARDFFGLHKKNDDPPDASPPSPKPSCTEPSAEANINGRHLGMISAGTPDIGIQGWFRKCGGGIDSSPRPEHV